MRIRKKYQVIPTNAKLENGYSTSDKNGYTCDYINNLNEITNSSYSADITSNLSAGGLTIIKTGNIVDCKCRLTLQANSSAASYIKIINSLPFNPKQEIHVYCNILASNEVLTTNQALLQIKTNGEIYLKTTTSYSAGSLIIVNLIFISED